MKKLCLVAGLAICATVSQAAYDGTLSLGGGPYQQNPGGEFSVTSSGLGSFQSFCTEVNEHLYLDGSSYNYRKNIGAVQGGGVAGGADTVDPNTTLPMDTISIGTAYLYSEFRKGAAGGANALDAISYFGGSRQSKAAELQNAIWNLEGEGGTMSAGIAAILTAKVSANSADWYLPSGGAYGVVALNLFDGKGSASAVGTDLKTYSVNQDILGIVPEPSTVIAGALLLLPFGASAVRILRRKS